MPQLMPACYRMHMNLVDLQRNDVEGAVAFAEACLDAGTFDEDVAHSLVGLQDNPRGEYMAAMRAMIDRRKSEGKPIGPLR